MSDDQQPEQDQPTEAAAEAPTEATPAATSEAPTEAIAPDRTEAQPPEPKSEEAHSSGPRWVVALVLVLVLGVGGGFLIGRATAPDEGPGDPATDG